MGSVVLYAGEADAQHEQVTRAEIARELATILGYEFAGRHRFDAPATGPVYFVPAKTLDVATARRLGITGNDNVFGGVVPHSFVATKVISHPLIDAHAYAPAGWSRQFSRAIENVVLPGFTAFTRSDALVACDRLLTMGALRAKPPCGIGGRGQTVLRDRAAAEALIAQLDEGELARDGLAFEQDLTDVVTYSVGQVRVGDLVASYVGTQRLTRDHAHNEVYGGSTLFVARGDFSALLALDLDPAERRVVAQTHVYDRATRDAFTGFFATRCNYDVARGRDARGVETGGVLEQSWRIGGASGVEMAALNVFVGEPDVIAVRASCYEAFDPAVTAPSGARIYFQGIDDEVGYILKYVVIHDVVRR